MYLSYMENRPAALREANMISLMMNNSHNGEELAVTIYQRLNCLIEELLDWYPSGSIDWNNFTTHHALTPEGFSDISDEMIILVIVRELVSRHQPIIRLEELPIWSRFVDRFKDFL